MASWSSRRTASTSAVSGMFISSDVESSQTFTNQWCHLATASSLTTLDLHALLVSLHSITFAGGCHPAMLLQ